jgi:hypothetical protein
MPLEKKWPLDAWSRVSFRPRLESRGLERFVDLGDLDQQSRYPKDKMRIGPALGGGYKFLYRHWRSRNV